MLKIKINKDFHIENGVKWFNIRILVNQHLLFFIHVICFYKDVILSNNLNQNSL